MCSFFVVNMKEGILNKIYTDSSSSGAFLGVKALKNAVNKRGYKFTTREIRNFLLTKPSYTRYARARYKFPREKTVSYSINDLMQADLMVMEAYKKYNSSFAYVFCLIDALSRRVYLRGLKKKTASESALALRSIIKEDMGNVGFLRFQSDQGGEFLGSAFKDVLRDYGIMGFQVVSETKASLAENYIRELKKLVFRYMHENSTKRWISELKNFQSAHNNRPHSALPSGMSPSDVNPSNSFDVFIYQHPRLAAGERISASKSSVPRFHVGEIVRIALQASKFTKNLPTWSEKVYKISAVYKHRRPIKYKIADLEGREIISTFYDWELLCISCFTTA